MSQKQDAMSEVAGQLLDQARGLTTRVAGISSGLTTLQQAGVSNLGIFYCCWPSCLPHQPTNQSISYLPHAHPEVTTHRGWP